MSIESLLDGPRLPPELEHKIFKIAALACPTRIPHLMFVARRVKYWTEPFLYRVVFLPTTGMHKDLDLPTFAADAVEQRPSTCLQHVKHICFDMSFDHELLASWLPPCTSVTNLFAHFHCTPEVLSLLRDLTTVQYLTIDVRSLAGTTVPYPLFLTVTHLELIEFVSGSLDRLCQNLALIPNLTHIALNPYLDSRVSHAELCGDARLQCIVFLSIEGLDDDDSSLLNGGPSPLLHDSRFVCIDEDTDYRVSWLRGAVFGDDYWALADAFIAAKRAGTINRSRYRISNRVDRSTFLSEHIVAADNQSL